MFSLPNVFSPKCFLFKCFLSKCFLFKIFLTIPFQTFSNKSISAASYRGPNDGEVDIDLEYHTVNVKFDASCDITATRLSRPHVDFLAANGIIADNIDDVLQITSKVSSSRRYRQWHSTPSPPLPDIPLCSNPLHSTGGRWK